MKSRSRKNKGKRLQNKIAKDISNLLDIPQGKDCDIESREMGQSGVDIKLYGKALEQYPFSIEVKNQEKWNIPQWIEQAKSNQKENTDWLLIVSKNHYKPIVIMDWEAFLQLYRKVLNKNNE